VTVTGGVTTICFVCICDVACVSVFLFSLLHESQRSRACTWSLAPLLDTSFVMNLLGQDRNGQSDETLRLRENVTLHSV